MLLEAIDGQVEPGKFLSWMQSVGLARRGIPAPVVGPKAYPRLWERLRAGALLAAILFSLGIALAIIVGLTILGMGLFLERAIS